MPLKCPHCGKPISDKVVLSRCGEIAGKRLAKQRGPDYFKELQAKRKTKTGGTSGGRPPDRT